MYGINNATVRFFPAGEILGWHQDETDSIHLPIFGNNDTEYHFKNGVYKMKDGFVHELKSKGNMHQVVAKGDRVNIHMWKN